jgi:hypothetical protein
MHLVGPYLPDALIAATPVMNSTINRKSRVQAVKGLTTFFLIF